MKTIPGIGPVPAAIAQAFESSPDFMADFLRSWSAPPTAEEHAINVRNALDSWNEPLARLSMPSAGFQTSPREREAVARAWGEFSIPDRFVTEMGAWSQAIDVFGEMRNAAGTRLCDLPEIAGLVRRTTAFIEKLPVEAPFFKLGTRAPKDSPFWRISKGRVSDGEQVALLLFTSRRMCEEFGIAHIHAEIARRSRGPLGRVRRALAGGRGPAPVDYLPYLWFREYVAIPEWTEFRCFMGDRAFQGATQYHGVDPTYDRPRVLPKLVARAPEYQQALIDWFPTFLAAIPADWNSCVYDVAVDLDAGGGPKVTLIETNAVSKGTFPGLFDWEKMDFDGELRWLQGEIPPPPVVVRADGTVRSPRPPR